MHNDADQLSSNCAADQCLCFCYIGSTIPLLPKHVAIFCGCEDRFVMDLALDLEDRFSCVTAHIMCQRLQLRKSCPSNARVQTSCQIVNWKADLSSI